MVVDKDEPNNGGSRPIPDPTVLTTQAVDRAMAAENRWIDSQIEILKIRLDGMDTATSIRLARIDNMPHMMDEKILSHDSVVTQMFAVVEQRFTSVAQQFAERDIRGEREARDNKVAVDAAFAAQKEAAAKQDESNQKAIDKSEKTTTESINKLAELFTTSNKALEDKIGDVARRVDRIEALAIGQTAGTNQVQSAQATTRTLIFAVISAVLGIIAVVATILAATGK